MANTKISALTAAAALDGTEVYASVQSAANVKVTGAQVKTLVCASPTLVTPVLGVATGTSLALGGATIGTNALAVTGTGNFSSTLTVGGATATANISSPDGLFGSSGSSTSVQLNYYSGGVSIGSTGPLAWTGGSVSATRDLFLSRAGAASLQFGAADVDTAPVAQTTRTQGALAGGTSNVAGANWTFIPSPGKGTGVGGSFIVQTAPAGSTGTAVNAPVTALTIDSTQLATFAGAISSVGAHTFTTASKGVVLKQGANGLCGTFVANGATPVVVNNSNYAITDAVIISLNTVGGTVGVQPHVSANSAGVSFSVTCTATDTSTYNYAIIKNAP